MKQDLLKFIRELTKNDTKNLSQKALKTAEEVGELAKSILPLDDAAGTQHRIPDKVSALEEACDVILCAMSVAQDLGFSDDEMEDMLWSKARYWSEIQAFESKHQFPVPFEIHLTIETPHVKTLKQECQNFGKNLGFEVKLCQLDMYDKNANVLYRETMLTAIVFGTTNQAMKALEDLENCFKNNNFSVKILRKKIECSPWHPAAPKITNKNEHGVFKKGYYEAHLECTIPNNKLKEMCKDCAATHIFVSQNINKVYEKERRIILTIREYVSLQQFNWKLEITVGRLKLNELKYSKYCKIGHPIIEFALLDTNPKQDDTWLIQKEDE